MAAHDRRFIVYAIAALLITVPAAIASPDNDARSYPDIGIMNSVLEQLLKGTEGKGHDMFEVSGSYVPGYGLLFAVTGDNRFLNADLSLRIDDLKTTTIDFSMAVVDSAMREADNAMKRYDSSMASRDSGIFLRDSLAVPRVPKIHIRAPRVVVGNFLGGGHKGLTKKEVVRIDKGVVKFLESYADAENKLTPAEHVSVVLLTGNSSAVRFYTVTRKQITDFRSGSESAGVFERNVRIDSLKNRHDSVDIMETILDKSIGKLMPNRSRFVFGPHSTGIYINGLGAFFICRMSDLPDFSEQWNVKSSRNEISELENRIVHALGTYGSSLRFLPGHESIMVSLRIDRFGAGNEHILVGIKKNVIDSYSRDEIDFDALLKKAVIARYE